MRTIKIIAVIVFLMPLMLFLSVDLTHANIMQIFGFFVTFAAYIALLLIISKYSNLFCVIDKRLIKFERLANDKYYICAKIYGKEYSGVFEQDALFLSYEKQPNNLQLERQVLHIIKIFGVCKKRNLKK